MTKLRLSVAMGDYDRTRPLLDGAVQIDGVDPVFMTLSPEEAFFRAFRNVEFDISELSLSSFLVKTSRKAVAMEKLVDTSATKVTLPFVEEQLQAARELLGEDYWSYGVGPNLRTLEAFVRHHHSQGLSSRLMSVAELFHPATYETYRI